MFRFVIVLVYSSRRSDSVVFPWVDVRDDAEIACELGGHSQAAVSANSANDFTTTPSRCAAPGGEHAARTALPELVAPAAAQARMQSSHRNRRHDLLHQGFAICAGSLTTWPVVLLKTVNCGRLKFNAGQVGGKRGRAVPSAGCVGTGNVERHDALQALVLRRRDQGVDLGLLTRDNDLPGALKLAASMPNSAQSSATRARSSR